MCRYGIEQLMKLDEVHAFHVPVRPFHLAAEIHAIREPGIQKCNDGLPIGLDFFAYAAFVHANCCGPCLAHG
jgi:hypothetical protein